MDYETQQVRVALSGTPLLVMEDGDEDFTPFADLCRLAARLFQENLVTVGWFALWSTLILLGVIFFFSLVSWLSGNQWIGLVVTLPVLLLGAAPVLSLARRRLALNIWDEGQAKPLEALEYAAKNLPEAMSLFWRSLYYEADLLFRLAISIGPAVLAGMAVHSVLGAAETGSAKAWGVATAGLMIGLMLTFYVWPRARRVLTFLASFNAYEKIDGQSGHWGLRCELMYHWLNRQRYAAALNLALLASLAIIAAWGVPAALILSFGPPPLIAAYLLVLLPFAVRLAVTLWYDIVAAGFYRYNFIPESA
jgi:hypothetical protein